MNPIAITVLVGAASAAGPLQPAMELGGALALTPVAVSYSDGTYTGPSVDAYWGDVQVQAQVQNGQIASLKVLRYPSDRRESFLISQQALPLLRNEVVRAQSAKVNIISGATLTSQAFMRSLDAALTQANGGQKAPSTQSPPTGGAPAGNSVGI